MAEVFHRRKEDKFFGRVFAMFRRFFILIGVAATILFTCVFITLIRAANFVPPPMPDKILLTYTFKGSLHETEGKPSLDQPLLRPATTFRDIITALKDARGDARVKGFAAELQDIEINVAQAQELRDTLAEFRKAGKFAYVYSDSYGGFGAGMSDYFLASGFEQLWLQPVGVVAINGVAAEVPFLRGLLDTVGVLPQFGHKGLYKSAPESLTAKDMSAPNREATEDLVNELYSQMVSGIALSRGLPEDKIRADVDASPFVDQKALEQKLVDHVGYYDEMIAAAKKQAGITDEKPVDLLGYSFISETTDLGGGMRGFVYKLMHKSAPPAETHVGRKIAVIYGEGEIVPYKSSHGTFGEGGMSAEKIVAAFKEVRKDDSVAAVVFRIDSPGGSPEAAETIRRAISVTQEKGRPVVISMGGYAASGGYWIASGASKIVAEPGTITGSIGVFGGKMVLNGLWDKLGVNWVGVSKGQNAEMWSTSKPFSDAQYASFDAMLGSTYEAFLQRVMEGRKMTHDAAEKIAEGRVWTGREAKDRGLVDELGGEDLAIDIAKKEAKIDQEKDVTVERFPPARSTLEEFITLATEGEGAFFAPNLNARALLRAFAEEAQKPAANDMLKAPLPDIR